MLSQEIRRNFLKYFKDHHHRVVPSSSVVPHDDPTLLFTNAGMNQFKDVFLGKTVRDYKTAATSQKCIRVGGKHNDLDNVGHTSRHLTFFEMLGNFSFGDYFKEQAIAYAWEVSTKIYQFDPDKIWITVFREDDESAELWKKIVPASRIVRMDEKDNFWAMGDTGPCGPCSELYYDRGPKYGTAASVKDDTAGERYIEFWNLVFMQFNRDAAGKMTPLPKQSIDTGSGLERVVALKMGVDNVFATDILHGLIMEVEKISGEKYHLNDQEMAPAFHVIADHIRSLSFAIADGAQPSNVERGYVLRKLLRRAVRYGRMVGIQDPFLAKLLPRLVDLMGADYPELKASENRIAEILTLEEEAFLRTLKRGGNILSAVISDAKASPHKEITGEEAFKLKDTYGLPLEEIMLIAKDSHLTVNLDAYQLLEEQAREKSKAAHVKEAQTVENSVYKDFATKHPCKFVGFSNEKIDAKVQGILIGGAFVKEMHAGNEGFILLDQTPFYAEKGGQVGDTGLLSHGQTVFKVTDCQSPYQSVVIHIGACQSGTIRVGDTLTASVEHGRRQMIQNNHTATHLLHWALVHLLGPHIKQAGSLVEASRFRFDFSHHKALSREDIQKLEGLVNDKIRENKPVKAYELAYEEVQKMPEIKQFFGDKYGAKVRVIDIEESKELCGGTHTSQTGNIGYFRILKEGSIAAGVRRIEATSGKAAEELVRLHEKDLEAKIHAGIEEKKQLEHQLKAARKIVLKEMALSLVQKASHAGSISFISAIAAVGSDELGALAEEISGRFSSGVILLAVKADGRCQVLLRITSDYVKKGLSAMQILKEVAPIIGGSGGGKPESAQAGGKSPEHLEKLFEKVHEILRTFSK
ncbi:MAG TPA: alanine--tRNA ligase [Rhabdochlamydiaceae bacterium]|nr:alanine--tRNA ligase [Rhabdochlamydiaceae bacterium]